MIKVEANKNSSICPRLLRMRIDGVSHNKDFLPSDASLSINKMQRIRTTGDFRQKQIDNVSLKTLHYPLVLMKQVCSHRSRLHLRSCLTYPTTTVKRRVENYAVRECSEPLTARCPRAKAVGLSLYLYVSVLLQLWHIVLCCIFVHLTLYLFFPNTIIQLISTKAPRTYTYKAISTMLHLKCRDICRAHHSYLDIASSFLTHPHWWWNCSQT